MKLFQVKLLVAAFLALLAFGEALPLEVRFIFVSICDFFYQFWFFCCIFDSQTNILDFNFIPIIIL